MEKVAFADHDPAAVRVTRPPPKLPHLNSHVAVLGSTANASMLNRGGGVEEEAPADLSLGSGVAVGASAMGERKLVTVEGRTASLKMEGKTIAVTGGV